MPPTNEGRPPANSQMAQTAQPLRHAARRLSYLRPRNLPDSPAVKQLCRWVAERVPFFAIPRYVEFRADLPRNPVGRVLKYQLRDTYAAIPWP